MQAAGRVRKPSTMPKPIDERKLRFYGLSREWKNRNQTFDILCQNYSAAYWTDVARLGDAVYDRENPALVALNAIYDSDVASRSWLEIQIVAYTTAINERDKSALDMIPIFATNFIHEIGRYKILEIMLFFSRLVAGHYKVYGRFEPKQVAEAWKLFVKEREREIDALWQRQAMKEREELHKPNPNNITFEEWKSFKPFLRAGYDIQFFRQYTRWLATWHTGSFRPSSREPSADLPS